MHVTLTEGLMVDGAALFHKVRDMILQFVHSRTIVEGTSTQCVRLSRITLVRGTKAIIRQPWEQNNSFTNVSLWVPCTTSEFSKLSMKWNMLISGWVLLSAFTGYIKNHNLPFIGVETKNEGTKMCSVLALVGVDA